MRGGLGNQMFQYALGKSLSLRNNIQCKIDISNYTSTVGDPFKGIRLFGLSYFNITAEPASKEEVSRFSKYFSPKISGKIARAFNRLGAYFSKPYIVEPKKNFFSFDKELLEKKITKDVYISGFWQSELYFKEYADTIRKELSVKNIPEGKNAETLNNMKNQQAVAIHIRHGDNANVVAKNHGVLGMDFYKQAIAIIKEKVQNPVFYLFSDDIAWAREQLAFAQPLVVVDWNGDDKNHEDMRLMYSCKHHIVANSTFSWWGAWLGAHDTQIVIAPKKYHQVGHASYPDYYPKHWLTL